AADFSGDGIPDLAVAGYNPYAYDPNTGFYGLEGVFIFIGNGDGTFYSFYAFPAYTASTASPSVFESDLSLSVGDFNADGKADLAFERYVTDFVTFTSTENISVVLGNGDLSFKPMQTLLTLPPNVHVQSQT